MTLGMLGRMGSLVRSERPSSESERGAFIAAFEARMKRQGFVDSLADLS